MNKRAKSTQPNPSPRSSTQQSVRNASRTRSKKGRSPSGKMTRLPCKDYLKELAPIILWKIASSRMLVLEVRKGMLVWGKVLLCASPGWKQPGKRSKKNCDRSAVAMLKKNEHHHRVGRPVKNGYSSNTRQLGCVFQDMEPPKSLSILRKSSDLRKPIRCVRFTEAVVCHANIRDQNTSLGMICPGDPHQRNSNAPNFEDRSQEGTEWQERCAREAAWRLAKNILRLKAK